MAWSRHRERERRVSNARTTLIDALRLADSGQFDEALAGCALAMVFLEPLTTQRRVEALIECIVAGSRDHRIEREALIRPDPDPDPSP